MCPYQCTWSYNFDRPLVTAVRYYLSRSSFLLGELFTRGTQADRSSLPMARLGKNIPFIMSPAHVHLAYGDRVDQMFVSYLTNSSTVVPR